MSVAFYIALDREDPGFDTFVSGKFIAQDSERLELISKSLGLPTFEEFVSYSPDEALGMIGDLGGVNDEIDGIVLPEQKWFDAKVGLDFVTSLASHIQANPSVVKNAIGVLSDLGEYKDVFEKAEAIGARWNLRVDF
jgi:hypothetical protein